MVIPLIFVFLFKFLSLELIKKLRTEDNGCEVIFRDGKLYLKHISSCKFKQFGVRVKSLYTLDEEGCRVLRSKARIRDVVVEREHDLSLKRKT